MLFIAFLRVSLFSHPEFSVGFIFLFCFEIPNQVWNDEKKNRILVITSRKAKLSLICFERFQTKFEMMTFLDSLADFNIFISDTSQVLKTYVFSLCAVLCCAVLCCAVLCCAVLCCAVLCCAVLSALQRY